VSSHLSGTAVVDMTAFMWSCRRIRANFQEAVAPAGARSGQDRARLLKTQMCSPVGGVAAVGVLSSCSVVRCLGSVSHVKPNLLTSTYLFFGSDEEAAPAITQRTSVWLRGLFSRAAVVVARHTKGPAATTQGLPDNWVYPTRRAVPWLHFVSSDLGGRCPGQFRSRLTICCHAIAQQAPRRSWNYNCDSQVGPRADGELRMRCHRANTGGSMGNDWGSRSQLL
jgi:hypothetical protein